MTSSASTALSASVAVSRSSVRADFVWTLTANFAYGFSQWAVISVIARLGSAKDVGLFALGLAVTAPFSMFAGLGLRALQASDADQEYSFREYVTLRLFATLAVTLVILGGSWIVYGDPATRHVVAWLMAAKAIELFSDVIHGALQRRHNLRRTAVSVLAKSLLSFPGVALPIWLTGSVVYGAAGLALSWLVVLVIMDLPVARAELALAGDSHRSHNLIPSRALFAAALPLGLVAMMSSFRPNIPRYVLEERWGQSALGVYAALATLGIIGGRMVSSLVQVVMPRLGEIVAAGDRERYRRMTARALLVSGALGLAGLSVSFAIGRPLLTVLFGPLYAEHTTILHWVLLAAGIEYLSVVLRYSLTALRMLHVQLWILAGSLAVGGLAAVMLVPSYGAVGAAASVAVGWGVDVLASAVANWMGIRGLARPTLSIKEKAN